MMNCKKNVQNDENPFGTVQRLASKLSVYAIYGTAVWFPKIFQKFIF